MDKPTKEKTMTMKTSKWPCGFCSTDTHQYCPGAIYNGDEITIVLCPCGCETSQLIRCLLCNNRNIEEVHPDKRVCLNAQTCVEEYNRKKRLSYENLYPKGPTAVKAARTGKDCKCNCGETTGGGTFKPGHADKLVKKVADKVKAAEISEPEARKLLSGISEGLVKKLDARL
jgi:hypothetical protein